jgi:ferredoxin-type protein NapG
MPDDSPDALHGRRAMFRLGLKRVVEPFADYLQERFDLKIPAPVRRKWLRPPGAVIESEFLSLCYRCGNCVDVCPAHAIHATGSDDPDLGGTPSIDPDMAPCKVCDTLACTRTCPSGALRSLNSAREIRMGLAQVQLRACVRAQGEACTICVERCPIGSEAINVGLSGEVEVDPSGCVGCGVCQHYCPALPKAIRVEPIG